MTSYGTLLGKYHYHWLQRDRLAPYCAAANDLLPQYCTEAELRDRAAELDAITLKTGVEVTSVEPDSDGVIVRAESRDTGEMMEFPAAYAVGCDGARSAVRRSAGLPQTVRDHERLMCLLVFRSQKMHQALLERFPGKGFFNVLHPDLKGYWLFFGRVDLEGEFFFHAPIPKGADPESFDFKAYVERAVGEDIDMEIGHRGLWDCRVAIADDYGKDRVLVAGDAAHNHPPYGGYGINSGFEDARNLGWKLAANLQGWAGPDLMASYDAERRPVFASTATDFIEASIRTDGEFLAGFDPAKDLAAFEAEWARRAEGAVAEVGAYQPQYSGSPIVFGLAGAETNAVAPHDFEAAAGFHLAPRRMEDGRSVYDALGSDFSLIALDRATDAKAFAKAAEAIGIPLTIISAPDAGEVRDYGARLILVRPDRFVAWAGDQAASPEDILCHAVGGRPSA